jgi:hypothetical protein
MFKLSETAPSGEELFLKKLTSVAKNIKQIKPLLDIVVLGGKPKDTISQ